MFNIDEIRYLCSLDMGTLYLSPQSSYEYLIYGDIDVFETITLRPIQDVKKKLSVPYKIVDDHSIQLNYENDYGEILITSIQSDSIDDFLKSKDFSIQSLSIKISKEKELTAFACLKESCYATWIDPYGLKDEIKRGLIEPINDLSACADKYFHMIRLMIHYQLDIKSEVVETLKKLDFHIIEEVRDCFFAILNYGHSYEYIYLLDEIGLLEVTFPLVEDLKAKHVWYQGLEGLKQFENILGDTTYFSDGVNKTIRQTLDETYPCGLSRLQMLKFSILFFKAHYGMTLKINAPERYEEPFTNFCDYFGFKEEACRYYGFIIQSSQNLQLDLTNKMSLKDQYEFYDEYQEYTIDILLIYYIQYHQGDIELKSHVEYLIKKFVSKYQEMQSINSEITTLDIQRSDLSDVELTLLIEDVKEKIFFGNLRYDRKTIISYLQKLIEQS